MTDPESPDAALAGVYAYHDGTKHHFHRFARSLGYLDWASQPKPFREFSNTASFPLYPAPGVASNNYTPRRATFAEMLQQGVTPEPLCAAALGDLLRHALGLSAWKQFGTSRWSLRANPSSGNLHPTEAYVVCGPLPGLADHPAVYHYAADRHALELRCVFDDEAWRKAVSGRTDVVLIALTSIHWREAWKYGERAFRYCQHDLGHAIAAISFSAALVGWRTALQPAWSHRAIEELSGVGREQDFFEAEPEDPGCVIAISGAESVASSAEMVGELARAVSAGRWSGHASQLSEDHVTWSFIDEIASATADYGHAELAEFTATSRSHQAAVPGVSTATASRNSDLDARSILLQRRSAVAFDGRSTIDRGAFMGMLSSVLHGRGPQWSSLWWTPRVHLALFVHRVADVQPGLYALIREASALDRLRGACRRELLWERADEQFPLWLLAPTDVRPLAARLSCDQSIASDGFFSLGMIADFEASLRTFGPSFYRHLFWETGVVGQTLYLEAEAAGARATGIGCFYDDPVHEVLGLRGHTFQSLYHFTVGQPVDDTRLTTEPGYSWDRPQD